MLPSPQRNNVDASGRFLPHSPSRESLKEAPVVGKWDKAHGSSRKFGFQVMGEEEEGIFGQAEDD